MPDLLLNTRGLLNLVINGNAQVDGLRERVQAAFPVNSPEVRMRDQYDAAKQEMAVIPSELTREIVTIQRTTRTRWGQGFKNDRHPTEPGYAWVSRVNFQLDIWGRTPVNVSNLEDVIDASTTRMHHELWATGRIALQMDDFETVPYEEETGIFRALARGYVQAAVFAAD